ncbi:hypothetical protein Btru_004498 [Bulinus truncatus]|nr:hypothetical protein Btru_004498 [Bulinus truncatus]
MLYNDFVYVWKGWGGERGQKLSEAPSEIEDIQLGGGTVRDITQYAHIRNQHLKLRSLKHIRRDTLPKIFIMASRDCEAELPYDKLSNEFLMCPLCYEQFRNPKVLPCQHTFCLVCLRRYVATRGIDGTMPCPMCKELVLIPNNDVESLKNNFMIVSLLHFVESSKTASRPSHDPPQTVPQANPACLEKPCEACSEVGGLSSFCQTCSLWLCAICTKSHSRLAQTSSHRLMTSAEVDKHCKSMVERGEKAVSELHLANSESQDVLISLVQQLPECLNSIKAKILSVSEEAHKIILDKTAELTQKMSQFQQSQEQDLSFNLDLIENRKKDLDQMQTLLNKIKVSNDGYENQMAVRTVERYLNGTSVAEFSLNSKIGRRLDFTQCKASEAELKNIDLGHLSEICDQKGNSTYLNNRPLTAHKVSSLTEREYVSGFAINKFADKFVVANNKSIAVFKNGSKVPTTLLSPLIERPVSKPWGIAYCEERRLVFVTDSGRHEGDGAVVAYTHEGVYHSVIASGLTLPRGITVHKNYIFVCDQIDKCIYIFNGLGKIHRILKKTADGRYYFSGPMFVSVGNNGLIAVSDNCLSVKIFDKECNLLFTYYSDLPESQFFGCYYNA